MALKREDYLLGEITHEEYYGQFCSGRVIQYVVQWIGKERLRKSTDRKNLNDIPLANWDFCRVNSVIDHNILRDAEDHHDALTYPWSASTNVCIAKQAAKMWLAEEDARAAK